MDCSFGSKLAAAAMLVFALSSDDRVTAVLQEKATAQSGQQTAATAFVPLPSETVQSEVLQWLAKAKTDAATASAVTALWADKEAIQQSAPDEQLDRVIESFALADPGTMRFLESCQQSEEVQPPVFDGIRAEPFYQHCVQLYYARWLTQHRLFDEALAILEVLNPDNSIDPASLFFYRAVCQQRLLQHREALDSLSLLQNSTVGAPDRFRAVAAIMSQEISEQEAAGLPEIARVMSDVQRRLDLGRSGEKVQQQEDQVIALLDKLLEEMEKQKQQQQEGSGGSGGGSPDSQPQQGAADSSIKGSAGEGTANSRELSESGSWGMADKQAEVKAREMIRQKFPANYLDAISQYTKKIAERKK